MSGPVKLVMRSGSAATALVAATIDTILAHAGESHADSAAGGWAAIGWYGVAAVVAVVVVFTLLSRQRPAEPTAPRPEEEPSDPRFAGRR